MRYVLLAEGIEGNSTEYELWIWTGDGECQGWDYWNNGSCRIKAPRYQSKAEAQFVLDTVKEPDEDIYNYLIVTEEEMESWHG